MNLSSLRYLASTLGLVIAGSLLGPLGCALDAQIDDEEIDTEEDALFVASSRVWASPTIKVCWVNPQDPAAMGWVEDQVKKTWEAASAVNFVGWKKCTAQDNHSVRVKVGNGFWPNSTIGRSSNSSKESMQLNFGIDKLAGFEGCKGRREFCIRAIGAHEFGHALGFDHEQNRPDTNGRCAQDDGDASGTTTIGPWDKNSIMNYCNPKWNGDGKLSPTDIKGVRAVYGI